MTHTDVKTLQRATATEPMGYIIKPFKEQELQTTVEMALHKHKRERSLKESEEKYRRLVELSPDGIGVQSEGRIVFMNPGGAKLFGAESSEQLIGMSVLDFIHPDNRDIVEERFRSMLERKRDVPPIEQKFKRLDGMYVDLEVSAASIAYKDKPAILAIFRDVTLRKQAEGVLMKYSRELEESNKLKDLFIDIMRHDMLNPAGVVRNMADMALEMSDDLDRKEVLESILRNSQRIIDMIEDSSVLATLESGEDIDFRVIDLGEILRRKVREMTPLAAEKNMKIEVVADGEFRVLGSTLIHEVFSNLLSNAIKYSPEGSEVVVKIEDDSLDWKVSAADSGPGVPDEHKTAIFERFNRIIKGPVKGTGLGLAILQKIVDAHGGRVWVEDNPCGGSIFFVVFPKK